MWISSTVNSSLCCLHSIDWWNFLIFQTVKTLSPGLAVFSQSELLMEFHRLLPFGFLEGLTLFSTAYETQLRKKEAEDRKHDAIDPQDSTWSGSTMKRKGPKYLSNFQALFWVYDFDYYLQVFRLSRYGVIPDGGRVSSQVPRCHSRSSNWSQFKHRTTLHQELQWRIEKQKGNGKSSRHIFIKMEKTEKIIYYTKIMMMIKKQQLLKLQCTYFLLAWYQQRGVLIKGRSRTERHQDKFRASLRKTFLF